MENKVTWISLIADQKRRREQLQGIDPKTRDLEIEGFKKAVNEAKTQLHLNFLTWIAEATQNVETTFCVVMVFADGESNQTVNAAVGVVIDLWEWNRVNARIVQSLQDTHATDEILFPEGYQVLDTMDKSVGWIPKGVAFVPSDAPQKPFDSLNRLYVIVEWPH